MIVGTWQDKAHRIIAAECLASYRQANTPKRKRHIPYAVPEIAAALVKALGQNDEYECKRLFHIWHAGALSLL